MTNERLDRANKITEQLKRKNQVLSQVNKSGGSVCVGTYCGSFSTSTHQTITLIARADLEMQIKELESEFNSL